MMEEWVARRIDSPHVMRPCLPYRKQNYLYTVMEYIEGQTLTQWMTDNPKPDLETGRNIIEQIAAGLRAFHRLEMLHRDLRPDNIVIDKTGTVKIIDFGSTRIAGVAEAEPSANHDDLLGAVQYTAPECLTGQGGSPCSDLYSVGVVAYRMLTGNLPCGVAMAQARTNSQQKNSLSGRWSHHPGLGPRSTSKIGAFRSPQALRRIVGVHLRPSPSQFRIPEPGRRPPDRA